MIALLFVTSCGEAFKNFCSVFVFASCHRKELLLPKLISETYIRVQGNGVELWTLL